MIDNKVTRECFTNKLIKKVGVFLPNMQSQTVCIKCKVITYCEVENDFLVKLELPKEYPFGHKTIWRQLDELI